MKHLLLSLICTVSVLSVSAQNNAWRAVSESNIQLEQYNKRAVRPSSKVENALGRTERLLYCSS